MKFGFKFISAVVIALGVGLIIAQESAPQKPMKTQATAPIAPQGKVEKTAAEWKAQLTPEQYRVLRQAGTEAPNGDVYHQFKKQGGGTYYCVGCGAELFSSKHKFDSRCGWPSFFDASNNKNLILREDLSHGMRRVEVLCAGCEGHLGHLFQGEGFATPKDQRFCINGVTLLFVPEGEDKPAPKEAPSEPQK
ncbi:MAG: peptide-methionine (R)-S-oxide reductase MsrB [Verrucomicrobiota bacterium]|jgi:peptide-methionine (R)-S-oxide reductase